MTVDSVQSNSPMNPTDRLQSPFGLLPPPAGYWHVEQTESHLPEAA